MDHFGELLFRSQFRSIFVGFVRLSKWNPDR